MIVENRGICFERRTLLGSVESLKNAQDGDLHVIPFEPSGIDTVFEALKVENKSYLFVSDSGRENLLT